MTTLTPSVQTALERCHETARHFETTRDTYRSMRGQQSTQWLRVGLRLRLV